MTRSKFKKLAEKNEPLGSEMLKAISAAGNKAQTPQPLKANMKNFKQWVKELNEQPTFTHIAFPLGTNPVPSSNNNTIASHMISNLQLAMSLKNIQMSNNGEKIAVNKQNYDEWTKMVRYSNEALKEEQKEEQNVASAEKALNTIVHNSQT